MVEIIPYQPGWPSNFIQIALALRKSPGDLALCIVRNRSTSGPGLPAKDAIDIQITITALDELIVRAMGKLAYTKRNSALSEHRPSLDTGANSEWERFYFEAPANQLRTHTHVRVQGRASQRYPLLLRDYPRAHPATAAAYAELKSRLAAKLADPDLYSVVKDPAVDLIYFPPEEWAAATRWHPGPSDA
jgi:GrpB-like predicted nucleotidyltransferase (UPF0157 family)